MGIPDDRAYYTKPDVERKVRGEIMSETKTFRCGNTLRWRRPSDDEITALIEATHGKHAPVLQQAWECIETGEVEWRDVPWAHKAHN